MWHRLFPAVVFSLAVSLLATGDTGAQQFYRLVPQTIYEDQPVTVSRWVTETAYDTQTLTEYRGVWVDEHRERTVTSYRPVRRERILEERYSVQKPVTETSYEERTVEVTDYEEVIEYRDQQVVVDKQVYETVYRDETVVVRKPVTQTVMQSEDVVTYRPQTTSHTVYYPGVQQVVQPVLQPGATTTGLQWLPRGYYYDPALGQNVFRRGGFHWVQNQTPATVGYQSATVPVWMPQQTSQTVLTPEVVRQQRPVEVTTYQDVVETRKVPVQVPRTVQVVETQKVPVTVRKPVTRHRVERVPIPPRYETQEVVRRVPFVETTYEPVVEVEPYVVKVYKTIPETREVQVPRQVARRVDYQTTQRVARTVWTKVPTDACGNPLPGPATSSAVNSDWSVAQSTAVPGASVELRPLEYRARPVYQDTPTVPAELRQYGNPVLLERRVLDATPATEGTPVPQEPLTNIQKPAIPDAADQPPKLPSDPQVNEAWTDGSRSVLDRNQNDPPKSDNGTQSDSKSSDPPLEQDGDGTT